MHNERAARAYVNCVRATSLLKVCGHVSCRRLYVYVNVVIWWALVSVVAVPWSADHLAHSAQLLTHASRMQAVSLSCKLHCVKNWLGLTCVLLHAIALSLSLSLSLSFSLFLSLSLSFSLFLSLSLYIYIYTHVVMSTHTRGFHADLHRAARMHRLTTLGTDLRHVCIRCALSALTQGRPWARRRGVREKGRKKRLLQLWVLLVRVHGIVRDRMGLYEIVLHFAMFTLVAKPIPTTPAQRHGATRRRRRDGRRVRRWSCSSATAPRGARI